MVLSNVIVDTISRRSFVFGQSRAYVSAGFTNVRSLAVAALLLLLLLLLLLSLLLLLLLSSRLFCCSKLVRWFAYLFVFKESVA